MNSLKHGGIVWQINGLGDISDRYDAILCDIWGVLHNGVVTFPQASRALAMNNGLFQHPARLACSPTQWEAHDYMLETLLSRSTQRSRVCKPRAKSY
jgi:ribonucleotide monophosphatase NagD (HAD superfamily)